MISSPSDMTAAAAWIMHRVGPVSAAGERAAEQRDARR